MRKFFGTLILIIGIVLVFVFGLDAIKSPPQFRPGAPPAMQRMQEKIAYVAKRNRQVAIGGTIAGAVLVLVGFAVRG